MRYFLLSVFVLAASVSCTTTPVPTPYRQAKIDAGIERSVTIEGVTLRYWDRGNGPAVVLLHGLGGSMYDWRFLFDELVSAGYRVLAVDNMGAGYSDKPKDGDYRISAHGNRLLRFFELKGIEKATLIGNSWGGGMALYAAIYEPARVDRLVLIAAASMPQPFPFYLRLLQTPVVGDLAVLGSRIAPKKVVARLGLGKVFYDSKKIRSEDLKEYAHEMRFPGVMGAMYNTANQLDPWELMKYADEFGKIKAPALILWGEDDKVISLSAGKALHEKMPRSRLFIYPECGHVPHMEYPGITRDLVMDFLRDKE